MSCFRIANTLVTTLICLFFTGNGWSATAFLTLDDAIHIALESNPRIEIAKQQYSGTAGTLTQARSRYFPHLAAGVDYGRAFVDNSPPAVREDDVAHAMLSATQLIYDFGKTTGLIDAASFQLKASAENLKQAYQDIIFQVKSSFYSVLEKQKLIRVARQAVTNFEQQFRRAEEFYKSGMRAKIDVTSAETNLASQKLNLLKAEADLKVARVNLEQVLGQNPNEGDYQLVYDEPSFDELLSGLPAMPGPLENLLDEARLSRPVLIQFRYLVEAADSALTQAKGDYWPTVDAVGGYNDYETDIVNLFDEWHVGVLLTWEFFSGFETRGKIAEARARIKEVTAVLRDFDLTVMQDVTSSYLRASENRQGVHIAYQQFALSREHLDIAEGRYKEGISDVLEFNDAQLLHIKSQTDLVLTYYTFLISLARIERAVGLVAEPGGGDTIPKQ